MITTIMILLIATTVRNILRFNNPVIFTIGRGARAEIENLHDTAENFDQFARWMWSKRDNEHEAAWPDIALRLRGIPAPADAWPMKKNNRNENWGFAKNLRVAKNTIGVANG